MAELGPRLIVSLPVKAESLPPNHGGAIAGHRDGGAITSHGVVIQVASHGGVIAGHGGVIAGYGGRESFCGWSRALAVTAESSDCQ